MTGTRLSRVVPDSRASAESTSRARQVDILIVDDDQNIALLMDDLLTAPGRTLHYAKSGRDALRELRRLTPAVILLDVVLGDMNGFDLAALVRRSGRLRSVPIVFMTGQATSDTSKLEAYDLGAIDYLLKPIVPQVLQGKVTVLCELALRTTELREQRDALNTAQAQLTEANQELRRLACTDPLTGLANRRELLRHLAWLREVQQREPRSHGMIYLDLNGFKGVNDKYGHDAGDTILCEAAERLRAFARTYDLAARLGGDEFCLIIHGLADVRELTVVGERLSTRLHRPYELLDHGTVEAPASVGLTLIASADPRSLDEILRDADHAMYDAKRAGGDVPVLAEQAGTVD
jgi:diguanylate cyclase (GGDEF)-like protein